MELILGGTFSGKSDFACERARVAAGRGAGGVLVIATALDGDADVRRRIAAHRRRRPRGVADRGGALSRGGRDPGRPGAARTRRR